MSTRIKNESSHREEVPHVVKERTQTIQLFQSANYFLDLKFAFE